MLLIRTINIEKVFEAIEFSFQIKFYFKKKKLKPWIEKKIYEKQILSSEIA